jgi:hypothetical protein
MPSRQSLFAAPAMLAALSLTAIPAQAADLPVPVVPVDAQVAPSWAPGDEIAAGHRRYRHYRHHRHRGIDGGDILAGILIIGGIAAIASAAEKSRDRYPRRDTRYPEPRRGDYRYDDGRGIDRAVTMCVDEIERNARVETVDAVNRDARGWSVTGTLFDGQGFTCSIGADGRIEALDYGQGSVEFGGYRTGGTSGTGYEVVAPGEDRQHGDDIYAAARARSDTAQPAYPGGPLPGEDTGEIDADIEFGTGYQGARR